MGNTMRKRNIKYPLIMNDGIKVRTLEDLQMNFNLERTLAYFENGKLVQWLYDRYEDDIADQVMALDKESSDVIIRLCKILGVKIAENINVSMDNIRVNNEKLSKVKKITDDKEVIDNFDKVAFSQKEFDDLLKSGNDFVYLYGRSFKMRSKYKNVKIIGLNNPQVDCCRRNITEYNDNGVIFENVNLSNVIRYCVGDIVTFGKYRNNDISWKIIDMDNNKMLVICQDPLPTSELDVNNYSSVMHLRVFYNSSVVDSFGKNNKIRRFLNDEFIKCFSQDEQQLIINTIIGDDIIDKIFLLSVAEAQKFFLSNSDRKLKGYKCWYLRSEGKISGCYAYVNTDGKIDEYGIAIRTGDMYTIRPAMYIKI